MNDRLVLKALYKYKTYEVVSMLKEFYRIEESTIYDGSEIVLLSPNNCGIGIYYILYLKDGIVVLEEDVLGYSLVEEVLEGNEYEY